LIWSALKYELFELISWLKRDFLPFENRNQVQISADYPVVFEMLASRFWTLNSFLNSNKSAGY